MAQGWQRLQLEIGKIEANNRAGVGGFWAENNKHSQSESCDILGCESGSN